MDQKRLELQKQYLKLPEKLKQAMFSVENAEHIQAIAQKYHLQTEKMQCIAKTAGLVLLGEIALADFEWEIQKACGFIPESARDIAKDVHQQIFSKIEQFLHTQPENVNLKQELANHGIEIKEPKQDKYREAIT